MRAGRFHLAFFVTISLGLPVLEPRVDDVPELVKDLTGKPTAQSGN